MATVHCCYREIFIKLHSYEIHGAGVLHGLEPRSRSRKGFVWKLCIGAVTSCYLGQISWNFRQMVCQIQRCIGLAMVMYKDHILKIKVSKVIMCLVMNKSDSLNVKVWKLMGDFSVTITELGGISPSRILQLNFYHHKQYLCCFWAFVNVG